MDMQTPNQPPALAQPTEEAAASLIQQMESCRR